MDNKVEKQNYLFKQIIEENYDPEEFQQFMFNYKDGVEDLNLWSMDELRKVVKQFKEQLSKAKNNSDQQIRSSILMDQNELSKLQTQSEYQIKQSEIQSGRFQDRLEQQEPISSKGSTIVLQQQGKYLQYDYKSKYQIFSQTIQCATIPPNSLLMRDVEIKVQKFIKRQGGLFQQSYVSYTVFTPSLNTKVERRYSDFEWLKKNLQILHPGLPVPPIAKKGQFRRYDDKHLWKRQMILEMFLNKLMEIPELKAQLLVENFLKIEQRAGFQKYKAAFKGLTTQTNLKNLKNIKGKVNLSIEPRINTFLVNSQKHLTETQPEIKKIYKQFKNAAAMLQGCGQTLKGIAKICEGLDKKDQEFKKKVEIKYCPNNAFTCLSEATVRLAQQLEKQAKTFRQLYYSLIKYESLHMLNTLDNFNNLAEIQKNYQEFKYNLMRKKLRLYEEGNTTKWGLNETLAKKPEKIKAIQIMLPKETKELERIRQKYGLYNFQMYEELNRFYTSKNYHIGKFLQQYCRLQTKISSEMMMIWVDMQTNVMTMRENKYIQKC